MESVCHTLDSKCLQDYAGYMLPYRWDKLLKYADFMAIVRAPRGIIWRAA
jgi:hypothetical protein